MKYYNETINAARLAITAAIAQVQQFSSSLSKSEAFELIVATATLGGIPSEKNWHDPKLYAAVRAMLGDE